jgi:hypothetical protein
MVDTELLMNGQESGSDGQASGERALRYQLQRGIEHVAAQLCEAFGRVECTGTVWAESAATCRVQGAKYGA